MAGIATDVGHQNLEAFATEQLCLRYNVAQVPSVHVPEDGHGGFEGFQFLKDAITDVAGMPQLVAFGKKRIDLLGYKTVSVRQYANT